MRDAHPRMDTERLIEDAQNAVAVSGAVAKGGVAGSAGTVVAFFSEYESVFVGLAAMASAMVAIGGFVANQFWRARMYELERRRIEGGE